MDAGLASGSMGAASLAASSIWPAVGGCVASGATDLGDSDAACEVLAACETIGAGTDSAVVLAGCCASLAGWAWTCVARAICAALAAGKPRTVITRANQLTRARMDKDDRAAPRTDTITPTAFSDYEAIPMVEGRHELNS